MAKDKRLCWMEILRVVKYFSNNIIILENLFQLNSKYSESLCILFRSHGFCTIKEKGDLYEQTRI